MEYNFKCKKNLFWKTYKVVGHHVDTPNDRIDLYFKDGSIKSIGNWSKYDLILGADWVLAQKEYLEKESGKEVNINKEL